MDQTYIELFTEVKKLVKSIWDIQDDYTINLITDFLIHQGIEEVNDITTEMIKDYHCELNVDDMFDWIHDGGDESPTQIKQAPNIDEMGNVLILPDGDCIFWYEIGVEEEPYKPYDDFGIERE